MKFIAVSDAEHERIVSALLSNDEDYALARDIAEGRRTVEQPGEVWVEVIEHRIVRQS